MGRLILGDIKLKKIYANYLWISELPFYSAVYQQKSLRLFGPAAGYTVEETTISELTNN